MSPDLLELEAREYEEFCLIASNDDWLEREIYGGNNGNEEEG